MLSLPLRMSMSSAQLLPQLFTITSPLLLLMTSQLLWRMVHGPVGLLLGAVLAVHALAVLARALALSVLLAATV